MADGVEIRTNLPEFKSHLTRIGAEMASKIVRGATVAAAAVFRKYAKQSVPKKTGRLHRSLYIKRHRDSTSGREHYVMGVRYKLFRKVSGVSAFKETLSSGRVNYFGAYYWKWVHEGHKIIHKRAATDKRKRGSLKERRSNPKGFVPGNPFLTNAFGLGKSEALARFFQIAEKRIEKVSQERTKR